MRTTIILAASALLAACGSECKLESSLSTLCASGSDCRTYDVRRAEIENSPCTGGATVAGQVELRHCGELRQIGDVGYVGRSVTFDASGRVIGILVFADTPDGDGCLERTAGEIPGCDWVIDATYSNGYLGGQHDQRCWIPGPSF